MVCRVVFRSVEKGCAYWQPYWVFAVVNPLMREVVAPACHQWVGFSLCCHVGVRKRKAFSWLGVDMPECAGGTHGVVAPGGRDVGSYSHTRQGARACPSFPDLPLRTRPAEACAPLFNLSTLLRSAAHRQNTNWDNEEPRRIAPHLFCLPLFTRARPSRRATPISA